MHGRVHFPSNPWPGGHAIAKFAWTARLEEKGLYFELDLKTADYSAEVPGIEPGPDAGDWAHPIVWNNYHACHLHSDGSGFLAATPRAPITLPEWTGGTYRVDTKPKPWDDASFHIYLLGHDSVAKHEITFARQPSGAFTIDWKAKVCLSYAGATRYDHALEARIEDARLEHIRVPAFEGDEARARAALGKVVHGAESLLYVRRGRGFAFAETR